MKTQKFLCACIALFLLMAMIACTKPNDGGKESDKGSQTPIVDENDDRLSASDGIEPVNFDGAPYRVSCTDLYEYEIFVEDKRDVCDAAVYNRNLLIEDKYKIEIVPVVTEMAAAGSGEGQLLHERYIQQILNSEDDAFDAIMMFVWRAGPLVTQGYFYNLKNDVPGINFEQPWWNDRCNDAFTVGDSLYTAVGDLSITTLQLSYCYAFNEKLVEDNQVGDLYQVVRDGKWTIDYVKEVTRSIYTDVNQDLVYDNGDIYGFVGGTVTDLDAYLPAFGMSLTGKNDEGDLTLVLDSNRAQSAFEKVSSLYYDSLGTYVNKDYLNRYTMFVNGQVMIAPLRITAMYDPAQLRTMSDPFGVLPYPKYDENQTEYYSNAVDNFSVFCLPYNVKNLEMVGKVTESLSCENYRTVIPAFYDTALKDKYTEGDDVEEMLDIIMAGRNYDLSVLFAQSVNGLNYLFRNQIVAEAGNFVSAYDSNRASYESCLSKIYEDLADLKTQS